MKKILFAFLAGCIPALAINNEASAQDSINIAMLEPGKSVIKMDNPGYSEEKNTATVAAISTKAVKDFRKSHKTVTNEKWAKNQEGYIAGFTQNDVSNTLFYSKKGQWVGSLKGYSEDKLDRDVRKMVKSSYFDYKITYVQEVETIETRGAVTYIVHLEDASNIKIIRVCDGEMDTYKEYKKQ